MESTLNLGVASIIPINKLDITSLDLGFDNLPVLRPFLAHLDFLQLSPSLVKNVKLYSNSKLYGRKLGAWNCLKSHENHVGWLIIQVWRWDWGSCSQSWITLCYSATKNDGTWIFSTSEENCTDWKSTGKSTVQHCPSFHEEVKFSTTAKFEKDWILWAVLAVCRLKVHSASRLVLMAKMVMWL